MIHIPGMNTFNLHGIFTTNNCDGSTRIGVVEVRLFDFNVFFVEWSFVDRFRRRDDVLRDARFREAFEHWSRVSRTSGWDVQLWPRQYSLQRQPSTRTSQICVLFLFSFHRLLRFLDLRLCALRLRRDLRRFALFFSAQRRRGGFSLLLLLQKRLHRGLLFLFGFLLGYLRDFAMRQRPWNGWIPNRPARWWLFLFLFLSVFYFYLYIYRRVLLLFRLFLLLLQPQLLKRINRGVIQP